MESLLDEVLSPDKTLQDEGFRKWQEADTSIEEEDEQRFTSEFEAILKDMEEYLKPILSQFNFTELRSPSPAVSPADSGKGKRDSGKSKTGDSGKTRKGSPGKTKADDSGKTKVNEAGKTKTKNKEKNTAAQGGLEDMGECIILLVDKFLMELPLEGLNIFQEESISSVSRDFSLQIFYNRLHKDESETEIKKDGKGAKESKPKGDQKRGLKIPALNRVLPPNCIPIDIHNVKYVVDPYDEARKRESESPGQQFQTILEKYEPFTHRWDGFIGSSHFPSQAEWEHLLSNCSAFFFSGMERFLCHILLERLAAMNFPECKLMVLLELAHTKPSAVRVRDLDEDRSSLRLSLELPTETAIILSLAGVHSIIANQWHTTLEENAINLNSLCENLIKVGKTTGHAVRILQKSKAAVDEVPKVDPDLMDSAEDTKDQKESPGELSHPAIHLSALNAVLYGLPNMMFM